MKKLIIYLWYTGTYVYSNEIFQERPFLFRLPSGMQSYTTCIYIGAPVEKNLNTG